MVAKDTVVIKGTSCGDLLLLLIHRRLVVVDVLPTHRMLLTTQLLLKQRTNLRPLVGGPSWAVQELLSLLVIILNESLYLVLEPLSEVIEIVVRHQFVASGPLSGVKPQTLPREGDRGIAVQKAQLPFDGVIHFQFGA